MLEIKEKEMVNYIIKVIKDSYKAEHRELPKRYLNYIALVETKEGTEGILIELNCDFARVIRRIWFRLENNFNKHFKYKLLNSSYYLCFDKEKFEKDKYAVSSAKAKILYVSNEYLKLIDSYSCYFKKEKDFFLKTIAL